MKEGNGANGRTYFGVPVGPDRGPLREAGSTFSGSPYQSADKALPKTFPSGEVNVFEWIIKEAEWVRRTYTGEPKQLPVRIGRKM